eukprot:3294494-Pleurochrysis_carterae.AAC.10
MLVFSKIRSLSVQHIQFILRETPLLSETPALTSRSAKYACLSAVRCCRCPEEAASYRATFQTDKQSPVGPFDGQRLCVDSCAATWDTENVEQAKRPSSYA